MFGLIYQHSPSSPRFYPTRLAVNLSSSTLQSQSTMNQKQGFVIIESSFQVYAFTTSPFQIALLKLFARLDYRLPHMVIGVVTKRSVRNAFKNNITAEEIIHYLEDYAAPQMGQVNTNLEIKDKDEKSTSAKDLLNPESTSGPTSLIPPNVADQIRLWESERNRLSLAEAHCYEDFASEKEFQDTENLAKKSGTLLWTDPVKKLLVTTGPGFEMIKKWRQEQKEKQNIGNS